MDERKKSIVRLFAAAALLFITSAYRQLSMRYLAGGFSAALSCLGGLYVPAF